MIPLRTVDFRGCRLTYRIDGAGPPLVMIQGTAACGLSRNPQIEILKDHYACLSFDNRGICASQPAGARLSVEQMAADTLALMDDAGWASAHIAGHSLGGLVALQIALMDRSRVRSLGLLCTFARGADAITSQLLLRGLQMRFGPRHFRRRAFLKLALPPDSTYSDEIVRRLSEIVGHDIGDPPAITSQQLLAMYQADVSQRLGELNAVPTLVISAEKDLIARPQFGRAIAAGIASSHYIEIRGASHAFPVLEPVRCAELLMTHFADVERGGWRCGAGRLADSARKKLRV